MYGPQVEQLTLAGGPLPHSLPFDRFRGLHGLGRLDILPSDNSYCILHCSFPRASSNLSEKLGQRLHAFGPPRHFIACGRSKSNEGFNSATTTPTYLQGSVVFQVAV